ncbi:Ficolin-1 [Amphibalanus amphitrite]|uniref:Ficolin-1 n=1 Tax=Amphibalanus amphitrite TaxID=1232801 RepID=A0A6A4VSW8_AMPAM|nr:Ficolin-1 [Amphibalanus amphitrite]
MGAEQNSGTNGTSLQDSIVRDCSDLPFGSPSGVYLIHPDFQTPTPAYCDMDDGEGWTVFQRRADISPRQDFYKDWEAYKWGLGTFDGEFWWGLHHLWQLTSQLDRTYELRVDLWDWEEQTRYATYQKFTIESEDGDYRIDFGDYFGTAGDSLTYHKGMKFSTLDRDNDADSRNCSSYYHGAWWYNSCHICNLNGLYDPGEGTPSPPPRTRICRLRPRRSLAAVFSAVSKDGPHVPLVRPRPIRTPLDLLESLAKEETHREFTTSGLFAILCPKEGCGTVCREPSRHYPRPYRESRPELCLPAEVLLPPGAGAGLGAGLDGLRCPSCGWCVALRVGPLWTPLELLLSLVQWRAAGWHPVQSVADRAILYVLIRYVYGERERSSAMREPLFAPPPVGDSAFLLFAEGGEAVGFATLKRRGQLLRPDAGPETFDMDVLDCVFVRRYARRLGQASSLLLELCRAGQLGVSHPTPAMDHLLRKFVRRHAWCRRVLHQVTWTAGEGHRSSVWSAVTREELEDAEDLYRERLRQIGGRAGSPERTPLYHRLCPSS